MMTDVFAHNAVTRLRGAVTTKPSTGAGSYAVTRLQHPYTYMRAHTRTHMRVRTCVRLSAVTA